ncbi:MAG: hemin receptor [Burkholderiales bacterium PBB5]|nr:MAG: hemin receptor [Burkholderiales bacterium PBB5]
MNAAQISLVRSSFDSVRPIATQAAAMFYDRLFERQPSVAPLFRGNMAQQGERLMAMIGAAVQLLDQPQRLDQTLVELGQRHMGYGVKPEHYDAVGGALLDTLAAGLGPAFTADTRQAWAALYAHVSHTMQAAALVA